MGEADSYCQDFQGQWQAEPRSTSGKLRKSWRWRNSTGGQLGLPLSHKQRPPALGTQSGNRILLPTQDPALPCLHLPLLSPHRLLPSRTAWAPWRHWDPIFSRLYVRHNPLNPSQPCVSSGGVTGAYKGPRVVRAPGSREPPSANHQAKFTVIKLGIQGTGGGGVRSMLWWGAGLQQTFPAWHTGEDAPPAPPALLVSSPLAQL